MASTTTTTKTAPGTGTSAPARSFGDAAAVAATADTGGTVHRVIAMGDRAIVHVETTSPARAVAQVWVAGPSGAPSRSSSVSQAAVPRTPGGHTMFDGGGERSADRTPAELEANIAVVRRLYTEVFNGKQTAVIDELVAPGYLQHNPLIGDGSDGLKALTANGLPVEVLDVLAQGDLVAASVRYGNVGAVDIFRVDAGQIVEHWDVLDLPG